MTRQVSAKPLWRLARWAGVSAVVSVGIVTFASPAYAATGTAQIVKNVLTITGTAGNDTFVLRLRAGVPDVVDIDANGDGVADSSFTTGSFNSILLKAGGGGDTVRIDESNGVFTTFRSTTIMGEAGNDTLIGGSGSEAFNGGAGDDTITPGRGNDADIRGGDGNDSIVWYPGDGSDVIDGQRGIDTFVFNGGNVNETITISPNGKGVRLARDIASVTSDLNAVESINVNALGGLDTIDASRLVGTTVGLVVDSGDGDDIVTGGAGNDMMFGGAGNDLIAGGRGTDAVSMGDGDDTYIWNPGDGNDTVAGNAGIDGLVFNGADANETIDLSANAGQLRLSRSTATVIANNDVETVNVNARSGTDVINVHDLTGTGVASVGVDLAGQAGTGTGDVQPDTVSVAGTAGDDSLGIIGSTGNATVSGISATVTITGTDGPTDKLDVKTLTGKDSLNASALWADAIGLVVDGGEDDDVLVGGAGNDLILGGAGNDLIAGGRGTDAVSMGAGDDTFTWNPGDANDTVEGEAGTDALLFNGANVNENMDLSADSGRVRLTRDIAMVTTDLNGVETINVNTRGGSDTISVHNLTGTGVTAVSVDLAGLAGTGAGDAQPDSVLIEGTSGADIMTVAGAATSATVTGLPAAVSITGTDGLTDVLYLNTLDGTDTVDRTGLAADVIELVIDGIVV